MDMQIPCWAIFWRCFSWVSGYWLLVEI